jgi:rod shape-determining protein MreD
MRNWIFLPAIIILGLSQATILDFIRVFNAKPDLLLSSAVFVSLVLPWRWAFGLSIFAGFFKDMLAVESFGINTLLFSLWSWLVYRLSRKISIETSLLRALLVFIIVFLHQLVAGLLLVLSGARVSFGGSFSIALFNSFYGAVIFPLFFKINRVKEWTE